MNHDACLQENWHEEVPKREARHAKFRSVIAPPLPGASVGQFGLAGSTRHRASSDQPSLFPRGGLPGGPTCPGYCPTIREHGGSSDVTTGDGNGKDLQSRMIGVAEVAR